ncbi:MAG: fibronectin type III domain-containing protein [Bacteroidota bacterium]
MKTVKLGLNRLSASAKSLKAKEIVKNLTGNTNFTTPQPALTAIAAAITDLDTAILDVKAASEAIKAKTVILHQKEDMLVNVLNQLANYVETTANNDEAKIKSAGMDVKNTPTQTLDISTPSNFVATHGDNEGEIDLHWDSVKGAKSYTIEIANPESGNLNVAEFKHLLISTKSTASVKNLKPGTRYYFRVAAVGASGQSAWSELAAKVA